MCACVNNLFYSHLSVHKTLICIMSNARMTKIMFNGKIYAKVYMYYVVCLTMGVGINVAGKASPGSVILCCGLS